MSFKVKQFPDGSVKKHKARLCVHGDQQVKGADYFEMYAPVISWSTVHTVMTLAVNLGLKSRQVDYTTAFVQVTLSSNEEVYMTLLHGWEKPVWVYKQASQILVSLSGKM
eukprot:3990492-Ditylum_brightwellii.AAC.1